MTAINHVTLPEAAHLFCDGASYDNEGRLRAVIGKCHFMPSIGAAFISSGRTIASPIIAHHLERRSSDFDDLQDNIADWLPLAIEDTLDLFGEDRAPSNEVQGGHRLIVSGYSPRRRRCVSFGIATWDSPTHPALTVIEAASGCQPTLSLDELTKGFGRRPGPDDAKDIDYLALTMLELQRQSPWPDDGKFYVGGHAELTTITKDGISNRILKRWPDKIGEFITPSNEPMDWERWRATRSPAQTTAVDPVVDMSAMSKLQRDVWERKQRKQARRLGA